MKKNLGGVDKLLRLIFALVFFIMGVLYNPLWLALSIILLLTAIFGSCAVYHLFGLNTYHGRSNSSRDSPEKPRMIVKKVTVKKPANNKKKIAKKRAVKKKVVKKVVARKSPAKKKAAKRVVKKKAPEKSTKKKLVAKKKTIKRKR